METLSQIVIPIITLVHIYLPARKDRWSKWGFPVGLTAQPFWFYTTISHRQWGLVVTSIFYTTILIYGIYNWFFRKKKQEL